MVDLAIGGLVGRGLVDGGLGDRGLSGRRKGLVDQQGVTGQTCIPFTAIGVEDPQDRTPARRPVTVTGDERFRPLTHDITTETDPRPADQLQADAGRFGDRGREAAGQPGRFEDEEEGLGATGQRGEPVKPVGDGRWSIGGGEAAAGQVEDEQVHGASGEERAGDAQPLVECRRDDEDEPLELDATGDGLYGVEAA
jgi:hypothetical protein